jgi:tRNA(Ile)-lysidine synthase
LRVALAYSGGADSTLLLYYAALWAQEVGASLIALHVDHGLSINARHWAQHCREFTEQRGIAIDVEQANVQRRGGASLEAVAREARYASLAAMCQRHRTDILLTAHNATDQAETVLLNLLRGAGVAGLAGMASARAFGDVVLVRPLIEIEAQAIRARLAELELAHIHDESNDNPAITRNAVRHSVIPALTAIVPDAIEKLARSASQARDAQELLDAQGLADLGAGRYDRDGFELAALRQLDALRAANALRAWFRKYRRHVPSSAALAQMLQQLRATSGASRLELVHEGEHFGIASGRFAALLPVPEAMLGARSDEPLDWRGEPLIESTRWPGRLHFDVTRGPGLPASWLREARLCLRARKGGERLQIELARPSRTLKNLYQEAHVDQRERRHLPLLYADDRLVFAAGLGVDARFIDAVSEMRGERVALRWERC